MFEAVGLLTYLPGGSEQINIRRRVASEMNPTDINAQVRIVALTTTQTELLECLRAAVQATASRQVVYHSEWLGYLPFGAYHWVEVGRKDISPHSLPADWRSADLEALAVAGLLAMLKNWQNPADEWEKRITYEVKPLHLCG